jgi:hypothetical protein
MPEPVPLRILRALARETLDRLALASEIEHSGESGRAREQTLIAFIEQLVPSTFAVSTGFVVDALGGKSKQVDVVVYRTDYHPILEIGRVKHFMVESVVAVLEVKAAIDSEADLTQALDNIASVKALDRSNRGRNYEVVDWKRLDFINRDDQAHQVFGAIVTEKSLARDFSKHLLAWLKAHRRHEWPNLYVDVQRFTAQYEYKYFGVSTAPRPAVGCQTMRADRLAISKPEPHREAPLVVLGYNLINEFRVAPRIDFDLSAYFPFRPSDHEFLALPITENVEAKEQQLKAEPPDASPE